MAVKIAVLKSGEDVIADVKEIIDKETEKQLSLVFTNPYVVTVSKTTETIFLTEENTNDNQASVNFTKWMPLTEDTDIMVPYDWVVTFINPHTDILNSYLEKFGDKTDDGSNSVSN